MYCTVWLSLAVLQATSRRSGLRQQKCIVCPEAVSWQGSANLGLLSSCTQLRVAWGLGSAATTETTGPPSFHGLSSQTSLWYGLQVSRG